MELPPLSTDMTLVRLVGQGGDALEVPANMWALARWMASALGGWQPAGTIAPPGWDITSATK